MKRALRMKCPTCKHWNRIPVNKIFVQQNTSEPKIKVFIPMYEPLETSKCKKCGRIIAEPKCGRIIAEPKELIRIMTKAVR